MALAYPESLASANVGMCVPTCSGPCEEKTATSLPARWPDGFQTKKAPMN